MKKVKRAFSDELLDQPSETTEVAIFSESADFYLNNHKPENLLIQKLIF